MNEETIYNPTRSEKETSRKKKQVCVFFLHINQVSPGLYSLGGILGLFHPSVHLRRCRESMWTRRRCKYCGATDNSTSLFDDVLNGDTRYLLVVWLLFRRVAQESGGDELVKDNEKEKQEEDRSLGKPTLALLQSLAAEQCLTGKWLLLQDGLSSTFAVATHTSGVYVANVTRHTALHQAVLQGSTELVSSVCWFFAAAADARNNSAGTYSIDNKRKNGKRRSSCAVDIPNSSGETPLMLAARLGNAEIVSLLLREGANPFAHTTATGGNVFHLVFRSRRNSKALLEKLMPDPRFDPSLLVQQDSSGVSPLHLAMSAALKPTEPSILGLLDTVARRSPKALKNPTRVCCSSSSCLKQPQKKSAATEEEGAHRQQVVLSAACRYSLHSTALAMSLHNVFRRLCEFVPYKLAEGENVADFPTLCSRATHPLYVLSRNPFNSLVSCFTETTKAQGMLLQELRQQQQTRSATASSRSSRSSAPPEEEIIVSLLAQHGISRFETGLCLATLSRYSSFRDVLRRWCLGAVHVTGEKKPRFPYPIWRCMWFAAGSGAMNLHTQISGVDFTRYILQKDRTVLTGPMDVVRVAESALRFGLCVDALPKEILAHILEVCMNALAKRPTEAKMILNSSSSSWNPSASTSSMDNRSLHHNGEAQPSSFITGIFDAHGPNTAATTKLPQWQQQQQQQQFLLPQIRLSRATLEQPLRKLHETFALSPESDWFKIGCAGGCFRFLDEVLTHFGKKRGTDENSVNQQPQNQSVSSSCLPLSIDARVAVLCAVDARLGKELIACYRSWWTLDVILRALARGFRYGRKALQILFPSAEVLDLASAAALTQLEPTGLDLAVIQDSLRHVWRYFHTAVPATANSSVVGGSGGGAGPSSKQWCSTILQGLLTLARRIHNYSSRAASSATTTRSSDDERSEVELSGSASIVWQIAVFVAKAAVQRSDLETIKQAFKEWPFTRKLVMERAIAMNSMFLVKNLIRNSEDYANAFASTSSNNSTAAAATTTTTPMLFASQYKSICITLLITVCGVKEILREHHGVTCADVMTGLLWSQGYETLRKYVSDPTTLLQSSKLLTPDLILPMLSPSLQFFSVLGLEREVGRRTTCLLGLCAPCLAPACAFLKKTEVVFRWHMDTQASSSARAVLGQALAEAVCNNSDIRIAEALLVLGADANHEAQHSSAASREVCSLLHLAVRRGSLELVKLLLEHGADPDVTTTTVSATKSDERGGVADYCCSYTPLQEAYALCHKDIIALLTTKTLNISTSLLQYHARGGEEFPTRDEDEPSCDAMMTRPVDGGESVQFDVEAWYRSRTSLQQSPV